MKLDGSVSAVVTGGASGLGLATVNALRAQGVKVAIFDLNESTGKEAAQQAGAVFCQCDVLSNDRRGLCQGAASQRPRAHSGLLRRWWKRHSYRSQG